MGTQLAVNVLGGGQQYTNEGQQQQQQQQQQHQQEEGSLQGQVMHINKIHSDDTVDTFCTVYTFES